MRAVAWCATTAPWTCIAAFGRPVVPLVKWSSASVSGGVGGMSSAGEAAASSARPSSAPAGTPPPSSNTITWVSDARRSRIGATLRAYSDAVVTSTLPFAACTRVAIGSGPNAENSGETTAWIASAPSAAAYSSGIRGHSANTTSPAPTPSPRRAFANLPVRAASSPYVMSLASPCLPRQRSATLPAFGPRAWRATATSAMLRPRGSPGAISSAAASSHRNARRASSWSRVLNATSPRAAGWIMAAVMPLAIAGVTPSTRPCRSRSSSASPPAASGSPASGRPP